ncbi:MAG: glycosyltransferase family 39 protein, partial [bacterium]
ISCFGICFIVYHLANGRNHRTEIMNLNQNQWKLNQTGGLIALVLILSSPAFIMNNSIGRSDNFGMAVSMAGVFLLIRYDKKDSSVWMPLISGLLMGAGPLIKQSLISSIVFGFYLSWKKNCFKTVVFTSIGLPALICSVLTVISKGDFIKICIVYPSLPPKSMMHSWIIFKSTLLFSPVHFLILGGTILLVIRIALNWISKKDISLSRSSIFIPWVLLSGGLSLFTSTRELGGSSLYWLEFIIISSAFLGECLSVIIERISDTQKKQILISVVSVLMIGSGLVFSMRSLRGVMFEWSAIPYYRELQSIVSDKTPPDEPIIEYFSNIGILTQRKVLFNDLLMYQNTTVENRELLNSVIASKKASCLLLLPQFSANYISSDYVEVPTKNAYPNRIFAVKVYLRKDLLTK